jgi:multisubunit Na+/H+ antiporter MnhF subunit
MTPHAAASDHLPFFITPPDGTDVLMGIAAVTLVGAVLLTGVLFLTLHSLPERMAHKGQKLQFEIVAVLCLLALFTHTHIFWVAALLLAFVDLPDFLSPLNRIARASETVAGLPPPPPTPAETAPAAPAPASVPAGKAEA